MASLTISPSKLVKECDEYQVDSEASGAVGCIAAVTYERQLYLGDGGMYAGTLNYIPPL